MKLLPILAALSLPASAATITQWNFNSNPTDASTSTGSSVPSTGTGIFSTVGGVTNPSFNSGAGSSDLGTDNTGYQTTTYPAAGAGNKTAGIQGQVSTIGFNSITVSWDQRHSNTSANTTRFQYTIDFSVASPIWVDGTQFTFTPAAAGTSDIWYNGRSVDLSTITSASDNANFAFRVVSEFDPVTGNYAASRSTSSYGGAGTWRFDMVTVSGNVIPEPTSALLSSFGLLALLRRRRAR